MTLAESLAEELGRKPRVPARRPLRKLECRLKELRSALGLSGYEFGKAVGTSAGRISYVERGTNCNIAFALKAAKFFGVKVEDIWQLPNGKETEVNS